MILVCHVISQEYVIKWLCEFMDSMLSWQVTLLPSLWSKVSLKWRYNSFSLSRGLTRRHNPRVEKHYE